MFFRGNESKEQRNMDLKYTKIYHDVLKKNRQETNQIDIAHDWAKRKARIAKEMQKKLEDMKRVFSNLHRLDYVFKGLYKFILRVVFYF